MEIYLGWKGSYLLLSRNHEWDVGRHRQILQSVQESETIPTPKLPVPDASSLVGSHSGVSEPISGGGPDLFSTVLGTVLGTDLRLRQTWRGPRDGTSGLT